MADCAEALFFIEDSLAEGLALHQAGELAAAEARYRDILALCDEQAEVWFYLGLLCQADGRNDEAAAHLAAACALEPQQATFHLALGNLRQGEGDHVAAIAAYEKAAAGAPDNGQAWYNLGVASFAAGRLTAAITAYERALPLLPDDGDLLFNLAIAYDKSGQAAEALRSWNLALRLAPDDVELRYNLALFHKRAGDDEAALSQLEEVVRREPGYAPAYGHLATLSLRRGQASQAMCCYERLLELGHDVEAARHMLAALRGERLEKAATGYVRKLFDGYAETFEQELVERLGYDAPARLRFLVERSLPAGRRFGRLLDLGCGTGLVGEAFRDLAATLVGVDLSGRMVAVARDKGIYDELEVDEAVAFCRRQERRFDAIVAADVLVYLGELGSFFAALAAALLPGGLVAFSTERAAAGFTLRPSGRYAHAPDYVAETAIACGLRLLVREETRLRQEQGQWLVGDLFILALAG